MQAVTAFEPMTTGSPKVDPSTRPAADFVMPAGVLVTVVPLSLTVRPCYGARTDVPGALL